MSDERASAPELVIGRYALHRAIAAGGMATVHLGRLLGAAGFSRTVAIKRLRPELVKEPGVGELFVREARLASRVRHPNVVPVLDVVAHGDEAFLVMEYVHGESLSHLFKASEGKSVQPAIAVSIVAQALYGLHAAHEAQDERGAALGLVHCDVSPQNILVGVDGIVRVTDFGIAKVEDSEGAGKRAGKAAYMAPEQLAGRDLDRRVDVYAAAVVLWEALTGHRMPGDLVRGVQHDNIPAPSSIHGSVPKVLDELVMKGLSRDRGQRFATARDMALALERAVVPAPAALVTEWVERIAKDTLAERASWVREMESGYAVSPREHPTLPPTALRPETQRPTTPVARHSATDFQMGRSAPPQPKRPRGNVVVGVLSVAIVGSAVVGAWLYLKSRRSDATLTSPAIPALPSLGASAPAMSALPAASSAAPAAAPPQENTPDASALPDAAPRSSASVPAKPAKPDKPSGKPKAPGFGDLTRF